MSEAIAAIGRGAWRYALSTGALLANQQGIPQNRLDADTLNLERDFQARMPEIYRDRTPDLLTLKFVPLTSANIQMTDDSFIAQMMTRVGTAKVISAISDDIPLVTLNGQTMTGKVVMLAAAGAWSFMDVFRASAAGSAVNVPMETVKECRTTLETETDDILALGYAPAGIQGFLKLSAVSVIPLTLGNWSTRTIEQIVLDCVQFIDACRAKVNYIESAVPNTLIIPSNVWGVLAGKMNTFGQTALSMLRQQLKDVFKVEIAEWSKCNTANPTAGARLVCYRRDEKAVTAVVPTPYLPLDVQARGLQLMAPAISRVGGIFLVEKEAMTYSDNALV
jgi:hypothetical protein